MSTPTTPIQVRARITQAEWTAIRKLALDASTNPADLIATWIRAGLATHVNGGHAQ